MVAGLFLFLYVPFLYQHGYLKAFIGHGDFPTIYWGARLAFVEGASPYVEGAFAGGEAAFGRRLFPYLYPPQSLLAFYPFSLVSYDAAKLILLVASHLCFAAFLYLFFFRIGRREPGLGFQGLAAALASVYVLTFYPVVDNLLWGQLNLIVLALLCLVWDGLKRGGRDLSLAVPLSLAVLLKTYPLLLVGLFVVKRRYGAAAWTVGLVALYAAASWAVLPRGLWGDWLTNILPTGGYGLRPFNLFLPVAPWNNSLNGFWLFVQDRWHHIFGLPLHYLTRPLTYLSAAAVVAATLGLSYLCGRRGDGRRWLDLEVALALQMMFLVAPLSWEHHFIYLLPSALIAVRLLVAGEVTKGLRLPLFAALCVAAWDFPRDEMFHYRGVWGLIIPVKFYAALALWACLAWTLRAAVRRPAEAGRAAVPVEV